MRIKLPLVFVSRMWVGCVITSATQGKDSVYGRGESGDLRAEAGGSFGIGILAIYYPYTIGIICAAILLDIAGLVERLSLALSPLGIFPKSCT